MTQNELAYEVLRLQKASGKHHKNLNVSEVRAVIQNINKVLGGDGIKKVVHAAPSPVRFNTILGR